MTNSDSDSSSPAEPVASSAAADAGDTMAVKDQQQSAPQASFAEWRHTRSWRSSHTTAIWWWTAPGGSAERRARSRPPRWRRPAGCNQNRPVPGPSAVTDPEIYLHLAAIKGEADYYDIVDFVPGDLGSASASESVLSTGTDIELVARTVNSKRTKLHAVTPQQWTAANSAIMARLIQDGMLGSVGISQYLNHSFEVGELGQVYTWQSVLTYDRSYRKLQARLNFPWGTDISHLRTTTLMPKVSSSGLSWGGPNRNPGRGMGKTTPAYKDEGFNVRFNLCRDYNQGSCNREQCKFAHRCGVTGCFGKHPAASHHEQTATKNGYTLLTCPNHPWHRVHSTMMCGTGSLRVMITLIMLSCCRV